MNKERLNYLLDYANKLQGFQSISSVHLHKEINEVVDQIRYELGLKQPNENVLDELSIDKFSTMNVAIESSGGNSGSNFNYAGPLHVIIMRK